MRTPVLLAILLSLLELNSAQASSATWNLNPLSGDWNTAQNWTPASVPTDTATFTVSNITDVSVSGFLTSVGSVVFNPGANAFTITSLADSDLDFSGDGIINNSGIPQKFVMAVDENGHYGQFVFIGKAAVGDLVEFTTMSGGFASVQFEQNSHAGLGTFMNNGGSAEGATGGFTVFSYHSTADQAIINNNAALASGADGGGTIFFDAAKAANATITSAGASLSGAAGGVTQFTDNSDAGNSTLIANAGSNGGGGGQILFSDSSTGGTTRVEVFGNASLDLTNYVGRAGLTIGSLEGDGDVILGVTLLTVGSTNLSTVFSGVIEDGIYGFLGALTKIGTGTLTLSGANLYTGGTIVDDGTLLVNRSGGSGTGTGTVQVNAGTLGGNGIIAGAVTVGIGSGMGAFLAPGEGASRLITLRIQSALTLRADATYSYRLSARKAKADEVVANGVAIESGAQFGFTQTGRAKLTAGTVFTAISNTSATPIAGTFSNLADDSTFTAGRNNFQVSYEGGDGNDLTLTVVP